MEIAKKQIDGFDCYSITGEFDIYNALKAKKFIENDITNGLTTIILDMCKVEYIDSTGIGVIIGIMKKLKNINGELILLNLPEPIFLLFEKTNLLLFFQIAKNTSDIPPLLDSTDKNN
jgi:anti-sigma B factor antagonist